jgi:hypothetical protein
MHLLTLPEHHMVICWGNCHKHQGCLKAARYLLVPAARSAATRQHRITRADRECMQIALNVDVRNLLHATHWQLFEKTFYHGNQRLLSIRHRRHLVARSSRLQLPAPACHVKQGGTFDASQGRINLFDVLVRISMKERFKALQLKK